MMRSDKISILMPVKNAMPYLTDCLASIIEQDEPLWELIAVDDHSTDESATILNQASQLDDRIQWTTNDGHGIIPALRKAYSLSVGNLITRMDADDLMTSQKLSLLKTGLQSSSNNAIAIGHVKYFSEGALGEGYKKYAEWLNHNVQLQNPYHQIYKECVVPSICWMLRKETLDGIGAFDLDRYPEDYDFCFRAYAAQLPVFPINEVIHHWRDHGSRTSRNDPTYLDNRFLELKIFYFLKLEYNPSVPVIVWGAGKKGKEIVKLLLERNIHPIWLTDNKNKIGRNIYGVVLEPEDKLQALDKGQVIVAIAAPEAKEYISYKLASIRERGIGSYWFC